MLRILGSPKKLCNDWTRRELLTAAGFGALGFGDSSLPPCADGSVLTDSPA